MADTDSQQIMEMVEDALDKDPSTGSRDLFERVKERFPSVGDLSIRQFHARYPLQIKRRKSLDEGGAQQSTRRRSPRGRKRDAPRADAPRARSRARGSRPGRRAAARSAGETNSAQTRARMRAILLDFAIELASVDAKADVVKVLAGTDRYVDQLMSAIDA